MTRRRRRVLGWLAIAAAGIAALAAAAALLLPPWLRGAVERAAQRELGRELRIAGPLDLSFSLAPRLVAREVTLANCSWGSEPVMARAGRVAMVLDLASLVSGPMRVRALEIEDARLLLETDGAGLGNWRFAPEAARDRSREPSREPSFDLDRATIRGLELVVRQRPDTAPVALSVERLDARLDPVARTIELEGGGRFEAAPWRIAGRIGTLEAILGGRSVEHALAGRIGETRFETRGRTRDPLAPGAAELEVSVDGPDLARTLARLGRPSTLTGAFRLRGRFSPAADGVDAEVEGTVGEVDLAARGTVSNLTSLERLDLRIEAAGPDASVVGAWLGVKGLPPRPFELTGAVRRAAGRLSLGDARVRVATTSLTVAGELGAPPRYAGTDLAFRAAGSDLSELSSLAGVALPAGPFELSGRWLRRAELLELEAVELRFRDALIRVAGLLGEPPRLLELGLTVDASGPDLARFSEIAGTELPPRPFELRGRVTRAGSAFRLDGVAGRIGDDVVSGGGRLVPAKRLAGSELDLRVAGPDLAAFGASVGLRGVPAQPFEVKGRLRVAPDGYDLEGIEAVIGRLSGALEGRVGAPSARDGTSLSGRVAGPALSDLAAWGLPGGLPTEPFSIAGRIRLEGGVVSAEGLVVSAGGDRAEVDGVLGALPDLDRLDAVVDASGPSLAALGRFSAAARVPAPARLPAEAWAVAGRVRRSAPGIELHGVRAKLGATAITVAGRVGSGADLRGTDLRFEAEGPDASLLAQLAGIALPAGRFAAGGQVARTETGLVSEGVSLALGDARAQVSGTLGTEPDRAGTDLQVDVSGPDLAAALGSIPGLGRLPAEAFSVSAQLSGGAGRLTASRLSARLGANDLEGRLSVRLGDRPFVEGDLRSRRLSVPELLAGFGAGPPAAPPLAATEPDARGKGERLLSEDPLPFDTLRELDGTLRLEAGELWLPGLALRDVVLAGDLREGALRVDRAEGTGAHGGRARASLLLEPLGDGYRLRAVGRLEGGRLVVAAARVSPEESPPLDLELDLRGEGRSLHEAAANGEGRILAILGSGQIPNQSAGLGKTGFVRTLLDALNPFRKSSDRTALECAIAFVDLTGGRAVVEPIVARTDKMAIVGRGVVEFDTEAIDFSWTVKPRRGVGVTRGSIANSYVKLGGTLASPRLDLKPLEAVTSTGAAVATAGLTILSRGIYDRITAEGEVCVKALAEARQQLGSHEAPTDR